MIGHFNAKNGLGEDARLISMSMNGAGIKHNKLDLHFTDDRGEISHYKIQIIGPDDVIIFCMPLTDLWRLYFEDCKLFEGKNKKILIIQWELKNLDEDLVYILNYFDQVFTISNFTKKGIEKYHKNVKTIPLPFNDSSIKPNFNFVDYVNYYFIFDSDSFASRKNPYDVIAAFQNAFINGEKVKLYIKVSKKNNLALERLVEKDMRINVISEYYDQQEYQNFINRMHVFVSLHRAEGFGRAVAEAILNHKIVISSKYGGVLDYLNHKNSFLVNGKLKKIQKWEYFFFENNSWFYPDIKEASELMKNVYNLIILGNIKFDFSKNKKLFLEKYSTKSVGEFIKKIYEKFN